MKAGQSGRNASGIENLMGTGTALRWLFGVFLLSLALVLGLLEFFSRLQDDLQQRSANEQARLFIGEEIVRGIYGIEKDFYRMTAATNAAGLNRVRRLIDKQAGKLTHDMAVLEKGGTVRRLAPLNIEGRGEVISEATYRVDSRNGGYVLEQIEIVPLLEQLAPKTGELEKLLARRWEHQEKGNREGFFLADEEIAIFLKKLPPYFERLEENANRLFFESSENIHELETQLQTQRSRLKLTETVLIGIVVLLAGIMAALFLRRMNDANRRLAAALSESIVARNENERLRVQNTAILNTLSDGIYATDMEGRVTFINTSAENILGWKERELAGLSVHQAIHHTRPGGENFPQEHCPLVAVLQDVATLSGEEHFIARDGTFIPVSYRAIPLFQDNELVGSLVSFQDVTQRKKAEAQIRLQQAALDAAANMIAITARNGIIEYVNQAFCHTTGYTPAEVIGKHTRILKSGRQDAAFYEAMWSTILGGAPWEGELVNRRKDGSEYPEQMTITPIFEDGEITHFITIKRDISEEAKTKTRLKLVETAIQNIDQGILITSPEIRDGDMAIQYVNAGFSRITGFSPDEAIGKGTAILRGPRSDPSLLTQQLEALRQGRSHTGETIYYRKDGSPYDVELQCAPVRDDKGKTTHFIGLLSDIGPRKQAESALRQARDQALETSRLKSEFLSTMSHEIRTPMNGIIGMTDLLLDTPLNEEQRDFTGIVRDSAQALLTIINDILDFSKIEAGKMEIEITDYSPVHLVEGAAELLAARAREKGLSLMTFIDPKLPLLLRGDPTRLRQVLLNLAGNAVKFTGHGEIHVRALSAGDGWEIRFEVEDTGIGMSPETLGKLFQSFTQADSSTTRKYGGTGLGLAICKRLAELMGGEIGVDSEEGKGSTFWFTLPLIASLHPHAHATLQPHLENVHGLRVLVVDDHAADRKILHRYLESWGMQSSGAASAEEALRKLHEAADGGAPYDIAMIDYAMPGANGIDLARAIRSETAFAATRLVLLSAFDQRSLADEARQTGFSAYLTKPVRQSQLFDSIAPKVAGNLLSEPLNEEVFSVTPDTPNFQDALKNGRLVLLAEDNAVNQKVAQLQLNKLGYAVHVVGNGKEAVEAAATLPYAAILMDCQMPVMDGFEATSDIRKAEQAGRQRVPIIAMTANAMQGDRERCIAAGMDDYVSKPFDPARLARILAAWIAPTGDASPTDAVTEGTVSVMPEATLPVIDFGHLHELFGDDPPLIEELLGVFSASTETLFGKLELACERREPDAIKALAHEAKGSSANMGLRAMADAAARLEESVAGQDWQRIAALHNEMKTAWSQALLAIQSYRKEPV